jgi:hypothetical protein
VSSLADVGGVAYPCVFPHDIEGGASVDVGCSSDARACSVRTHEIGCFVSRPITLPQKPSASLQFTFRRHFSVGSLPVLALLQWLAHDQRWDQTFVVHLVC